MRTRRYSFGLKRTLLTGIFIVAPFILTFMLLSWLAAGIDKALAPLFGFIGRPVPGLGLALAFVLILLAGMLGSNITGQHILELLEDFLLKIPVFNWIYRTIKQLSEVFSPESKTQFKGVVLVEYPRPNVYSLGFVTKEFDLQLASGKQEMASVYIPTNHMYIGDYVLVPKDRLIATRLTQQEGIQAAISAGASLPDFIKFQARSQS